jgi:hypothetical protein
MRHRVVVAALVVAAACGPGSTDSNDNNAVTLSARLGSSAGAPGPLQASGVELTRVRIAVRSLRVERKDSGADVEISAGPLLLDVNGPALSGSLLQLVQAAVPPGTYDKLKVNVRRVTIAPSSAFDDLVHRGASMLLEGRVDGQTFTFASGLEAELEHEGEFALGATATNITVNLDPSRWFMGADGSRLDPRADANRDAIEDNIRRSFSAFEDDDEDGFDDHGHRDDRRGADGGVDDGGHHDGGDDRGGQHDGGVDDHGHDDAGPGQPGPGQGQPDAGPGQPDPGTGQPDGGVDDHGGHDGGDDRGGGGSGGGPGPGGGGHDDGGGHG